MKRALTVIEARRAEYEAHPFIRWLVNDEVQAEARLAYAPFACHFVMTFSEINRYYLHGSETDALQSVVNRHANEDGRHWSWFLQDMSTLGFNPMVPLNDALKFLFCDAGRQTREMGYYTISVVRDATPELKLVVIEALEAMGNVWLSSTLKAARAHPRYEHLVYFGQHHLDRETGHAMGTDQSTTASIRLDDDTLRAGTKIIHGLFDRMERFNGELLERTQRVVASQKMDAFVYH